MDNTKKSIDTDTQNEYSVLHSLQQRQTSQNPERANTGTTSPPPTPPPPKKIKRVYQRLSPKSGRKNKLEKGKFPRKDKQYKNKNKITQQQPTPPPKYKIKQMLGKMEPYQNKRNTTKKKKKPQKDRQNKSTKKRNPLPSRCRRVWGALSCGCALPPALLSAGVRGYGRGEASIKTLKAHTPQIWRVKIHPQNSGGESSKVPCFTVVFGVHSLNLGGEIPTPQIWGVWVFREQHWLSLPTFIAFVKQCGCRFPDFAFLVDALWNCGEK